MEQQRIALLVIHMDHSADNNDVITAFVAMFSLAFQPSTVLGQQRSVVWACFTVNTGELIDAFTGKTR